MKCSIKNYERHKEYINDYEEKQIQFKNHKLRYP